MITDLTTIAERDFIRSWIELSGLTHCKDRLFISKCENGDMQTMSLNLYLFDADDDSYKLLRNIEELDVEHFINFDDMTKYAVSELGA